MTERDAANPALPVLQRAEAELASAEPMPAFSPSAFTALKNEINRYVVELINESLKEAKRQRLESVSEVHVERASAYLVSHATRRFSRFLGFLGGILLGAAVSRLFSMTIAGTYSGATIATTAGVAIVGALLSGIHFAKA
jgi:hypothetical protein